MTKRNVKESGEPVVYVLRYLLQQKLAISSISVRTLEPQDGELRGEYVHIILRILYIRTDYLHFFDVC